MFDLIKKLITPDKTTPSTGNGLKIEIAAGVVLLEAAQVDGHCAPEEMEHILHSMQETFGLEQRYLTELLELANHEKEQAVDLWQFTNRINQEFSLQDKKKIMEAAWRVILADGQLEKHEDHYIRKLTNLLRLSHPEMIEAKTTARKQLKGQGTKASEPITSTGQP